MGAAAQKPSWFYWVIAVLAVLWGLFGGFDFWMTVTGNETYLKDFPPEMIAWIQGFPMWRALLWAISVASGVAGGVLLLMRSAVAVVAFYVNVGTMLIGFLVHDLLMANGVEMYGSAGLIGSAVICVVSIGFALYAHNAARRGVLR